MKVPLSFFQDSINDSVKLEDLSNNLFQLGHEHEIEKNIFNFELTPNRGDCLSLYGMLRDLNVFYDLNRSVDIYDKTIKDLNFNFLNKAKLECPNIAFLKLEIEDSFDKKEYLPYLERYFNQLDNKKVNFFTDISNYISFELGQPTHCYDFKKLDNNLTLEKISENKSFESLFNDEINLTDTNLVFRSNDAIVNLAGIIGSSSTMCNSDTKTVLVECAYFCPEIIIGKSVKYDIKSDAAHKFERSVDPLCHEYVLRRFIKIVSDHVSIKNVEIDIHHHKEYFHKKINLDVDKINTILGTNITLKKYKNILQSIGFKINSKITVPSWRDDIKSNNDLAEEVARIIGYDNIKSKPFNIRKKINNKNDSDKEAKIIELLIGNGFNEIINSPFTSEKSSNAIIVDNPIDSTKPYLRTNLKNSLLNNLIFNERRQQDSIKFFEISDVYTMANNDIKKKRKLGIIASGRVDHNYKFFNKQVDRNYLNSCLGLYLDYKPENLVEISRDKINLKSKSNKKIFFLEIDLDNIHNKIFNYEGECKKPSKFITFTKVSDFPSIFRDLSISSKKQNEIQNVEKYLLNYSNDLIVESFIFDYFYNKNKEEFKIGFRFRFQAKRNLLDDEVDDIMNGIMQNTIELHDVTIPGFLT